ncbi:LysR family transcriptional regulator [Roseateles chitinivorans]|uniref:LysR family transcriptional regulator n=1 Tax=Roseateles chitinivorans TaxID=2917965 RepID=UPI003D672FB0
MDQLHSMRVFVAVAEVGGFAGAARKLNLSPATVTRAVLDLEEHLGASLFTRTTRVVRLTDAGSGYLEDCKQLLGDLAEADGAVASVHGTPRGRVTITAPAMFGNLYIAPLVTDYLRRFTETQAVCLFVDRVVNMDDEAVDVAVRLGELPDSSLQAVRVGTIRRVLCASPDYLERRGTPQHPEELARHTIISATGLTPTTRWHFAEQDEARVYELRPTLMTTTNDAAITAAVGGLGITRLMSYQVREPLRDGRLQTLLSAYESGPVPIHVLHRQGRRPNAKVRALLDLLIEQLRADPSLT